MTKPKQVEQFRTPEQIIREKFTLEVVADGFLMHLLEEVKLLREDVAFYRGKCERLELSIMNSETKAEARVEFVERSEPAAPSIRNVTAQGAPPSSRAGTYKTKFQTMQEKWDSMTPEQQAAAQGLPVPEPKPQTV
jgi:hypothetical protein